MFNKLRSLLSGYKTHIIALVILVLNFAVYMNWINPAQLTQINLVLGALGLSALRAAVAKS